MASRMSTANKLKLIVTVVAVVLVIIVILQNMEPATTQLLFATIEMPRAVLLIINLLIGFGAGMLTTWIYYTRKQS